MKIWLILSACLTLVACQSTSSYKLSKDVSDNHELAFIKHHGEGRFHNYLAMNIRFEPILALFEQLNEQLGGQLKNRGEAHVTVITPPEFDNVLSRYVTIAEIEQIAIEQDIQSSQLLPVCLGKGEVKADEKILQTYFVVVRSAKLFDIRSRIERLFIERGGKKGEFAANRFYPHITVGFNPRDLHLSDGIVKDHSSCFADLN